MSTKPEPKKTKGMCIATRCTSVEQFIQMFHRFVDEESFFVSTLNTRPPGLETSFSVQLVDGTPVLRGMCVVTQAWTDGNNPFKTPGVRLGIKRLTANSMVVFEQLLVTRSSAKPTATKPNGTPQQVTPVATKPMAGAAPKPVTPVTTKPFGAPKLKAPATIAVGVPKNLPPKSPITETAPTKHPPSRLELKQPVRPPTGPSAPAVPIPDPISAESTDLIEEKTDVREAKTPSTAFEQTRDAGPKTDKPSASSDEVVAKPAPKDEGAPTLPPDDLAVPVAEPAKPPPQVVRDQLAAELELAKPADSGDDSRTPGSELVLPANPLMNLTDESLEGYVDCTLYEETGNFFPVDGEDGDFVDDVVPPPGLAAKNDEDGRPESRQRTITPLPATPDAYAAARESSPSLVVPPPLPTPAHPRESVMVDPDLIARGSTPAFEPAPKSAVDTPTFTKDGVHKPSFDADALPLPAAASHDRLVPTPHKRPRWWLLGGIVGLLSVVAAIIVITTASSSDGNSAPPTAKPTKQAAQIAPAGSADAMGSAVDPADPTEEELEEPPPGSGPPLVGEGPCQVVVASTPASSMVEIDGKTVGPSPLTVGAACGEHKVEVRHARYQSITKVVTLTEGKPASVDVTLQRPTHTVTVTSNPPGATIFIDGRSAGTTPTKLNVLGFVTLKLEFKKTGYQPTQAKFYSRYAQDKVTVKLNKW